MLRLILILYALWALSSCRRGDYADQVNALNAMVKQVSFELKELGFDVNPNEITIDVKSAETMTTLFNDISAESKQNVGDQISTFGEEDPTESKIGESRLAFYDANTKTLTFKADAIKSLTKGYLAHELAHVYQDQKWGLKQIWQPFATNPSREVFHITQFVVEGHAELARYAYEQAEASSPVAISDLSVSLGKVFDSECVVCHSKNSLSNLPYSMGMRFLAHQYKLGGWSRVQDCLLALPSSSEQILHPKKYLADDPTSVSLAQWPKGKLDFSGTMGEASLLMELLRLKVPNIEAFTSASGWDGDIAHVYQLPNQKKAMVWRIVADRKIDAMQLENTLNTYDPNGQNIRSGRVVDWIISDQQDAINDLRIFLSDHPVSLAADKEDEVSTTSQESAGIRNATVHFFEPKRRTRLFIGPNK